MPRPNRLATFGGRMKAVRLAKGLRAEDVAKALKVSRPTISSWEFGNVERPPIKKLKIFAKMTTVSFDWLLAGVGTPPKIPLDIPDAEMIGRGKRTDRVKKRVSSADDVGADDDDGGVERVEQQDVSRPHHYVPQQYVAIPEIEPFTVVIDTNVLALARSHQMEWTLPRDVVSMALNCDPARTVVQRILVPPGPALAFKKGDYVLIDTGRTRVNEPGTYIVADEENQGTKWVVYTDDVIDNKTANEQPVLGRLMGVLQAA